MVDSDRRAGSECLGHMLVFSDSGDRVKIREKLIVFSRSPSNVLSPSHQPIVMCPPHWRLSEYNFLLNAVIILTGLHAKLTSPWDSHIKAILSKPYKATNFLEAEI